MTPALQFPCSISPDRVLIFSAICLFLLCLNPFSTLAQNAPPSEQSMNPPSQDPVWRSPNQCGVNCTYVLLKLLESDVSYNDVVTHVPVSSQGTSIVEIQTYLQDCGVSSDVVKASPSDLKALAVPMIAFLESNSSIGHFVLILSANGQFVEYVDGTTGSISNATQAEFAKQWSGHLLIPAPQRSQWFAVIFSLSMASIASFAIWALKYRRQVRQFNTAVT